MTQGVTVATASDKYSGFIEYLRRNASEHKFTQLSTTRISQEFKLHPQFFKFLEEKKLIERRKTGQANNFELRLTREFNIHVTAERLEKNFDRYLEQNKAAPKPQIELVDETPASKAYTGRDLRIAQFTVALLKELTDDKGKRIWAPFRNKRLSGFGLEQRFMKYLVTTGYLEQKMESRTRGATYRLSDSFIQKVNNSTDQLNDTIELVIKTYTEFYRVVLDETKANKAKSRAVVQSVAKTESISSQEASVVVAELKTEKYFAASWSRDGKEYEVKVTVNCPVDENPSKVLRQAMGIIVGD